MNSNIKQDIMDTARQLFSEKGFQDTYMRDIAAVLNISVGNLTYHYKKKEDLIEAILLQDHQKYQKPTPLYTLDDLNQLLEKVAGQRNSRPYYYRHYVQLAQMSPAIYKMQVSVLKDLKDVLTESFQNFVAGGLLKKEFMEEYYRIIDVIMALMVYGLPDFCQIQEQENCTSILSCVWSIIIPCLTRQGCEEYRLLISGKKSEKS